MLVECGRLIERETVWLLREIGIPLDIADEIGRFGPGIGTLASRIESLLSTADRELLEQRSAQFVAEGAPQALARRLSSLPFLAPVCDKTGRASCRERLCQYVTISVVALSLTHKQHVSKQSMYNKQK